MISPIQLFIGNINFKTKLTAMKKLLIILLSVSVMQVMGQTKIEIDFAKKEITTLPTKSDLQTKKTVYVKIINLPANSYKISINKTDSIISPGTPPGLFSVLSFGDGFNSLLAGLTSYTIHTAPSLSTGTATTTSENGRNPASEKFDKEKVKLKIKVAVNPCYTPEAADINETIKTMRKAIFDFHYSFRDEVIKKADDLLYQVGLGLQKDASLFKTEADKIIVARLKKDKELEEKFVKYYDEILKLKSFDLLRTCAALKAGDSMLTEYKRNFDLFLNKFDTTFNETLIVKVFKQLKAPATSEFVSLPYRLNGDISKLAIDITGVDAAKTPQSYNTVIELEKHPNRLWAFTTGVFVSGLKNDEFSILANVKPNAVNPAKLDTLNYSILQEKNNGISAGINALMHIGGYFKENGETGGYIAFGPGLTLEKAPQVRIMIGAGLLFGRSNKLALSVGWCGGPVKRLSANYNTTNTYNPAPTDITRDRFNESWFASIGYALFGK